MLRRFGVALLGVHAAIHLLGTMVYWKIGEPHGLAYRTELLGGVKVLSALLVRRGVGGAGRGNTYGDRQGYVRPEERRGLKWTQGSVYGRL